MRNSKGSKQREVYFTTECTVWIKKYLASHEDSCKALFVTDTHPIKRMAIPTIRWTLKRLADRGEIEANVYPHRLRHTYACQLLDNGAPLDFIQGLGKGSSNRDWTTCCEGQNFLNNRAVAELIQKPDIKVSFWIALDIWYTRGR
ncbi:tyrosine-type recombinase/integrase [Paenibacillus methanolicus]|uniref:tyrosine-type recombinase/integrase n=1 Tax=Paenibacillus methanolicus TaxID=582686 RepID=UPI001FE7BEC4|nr:tyrosine-type recombinase/integrase [Paenibacillus methanolicus]